MTLRRWRAAGALVACCLIAGGCTPRVYSALEVNRRLGRAVGAAQAQLGQRKAPEAAQLIAAVERIDPGYPELSELRAELGLEVQDLFAETPLGMNRARRVPISRGIFGRVIRYVPDRLGDLLDVVSFEAHGGVGLYADVHLTRGVQLSGGGRAVGGLGLLPQRAVPGFQLHVNGGVHAISAGVERYFGVRAGPGGVFTASDVLRGSQGPGERFYQDYRDYWAIGASGTLGAFGATGEVRPVQIVDFLLGWVGIDIANDDSARTRPLDLLQADRELLEDLGRIAASEESLEDYRARIVETR